MEPRKVNVFIATYPYGGNGGFQSEHPDIRKWMVRTITKAEKDPRIGHLMCRDYADTPIPMTRNKSVLDAREFGADIMVMVDSDQAPDYLLASDPTATPFWDAAFDFIYDRYEKGPHVVGSPYCGPPCGHENVYVFRWETMHSDDPNDLFKLEPYSREEAAVYTGIQECAALPTGLIMYDMRIFDLVEPKPGDMVDRIAGPLMKRIEAGNDRFTPAEMRGVVEWICSQKRSLEESFFYYEWKDRYASEKVSTEDVTATRDMSLAGTLLLGYNPVHCAWSSWAGHWKPKLVGKPSLTRSSAIGEKLRHALSRPSKGVGIVELNTPEADRIEWDNVDCEGEDESIDGNDGENVTPISGTCGGGESKEGVSVVSVPEGSHP